MSSSKRKATSHCEKVEAINVLLCGPSGAGKSTIRHVIKHGETNGDSLPTIGVDFENVIINDVTIRAWEIGGRERFRPLQRRYFDNSKAFIFVIDSNDQNRIDEVCQELNRMTNDNTFKDKPLLIFANKQDLANSMTIDQLKDKLNLDKLDKTIQWHLQSSSAIQNQGLNEGFQWLVKNFLPKTNLTDPIIETFNDSIAFKNNLATFFNLAYFKKFFSKFVQF